MSDHEQQTKPDGGASVSTDGLAVAGREPTVQQPWNDHRLKMNGVYIGCVTKQNADILMAQAAMVKCLYRFIDRMNDVCPEDPADRIVSEFTAAAMPLFDKHLDALFPKRAALKTANVLSTTQPCRLSPPASS